MAANVAFEILYREYYVRVFGLCRRLLNSPQLAEDASQETFMRAFRSFDKFDNQQPFWQWIATIANNHCIDLLRKSSRSVDLFGDETAEFADLESTEIPPLMKLVDSEDTGALIAAISGLPDKYRIPVVLAYFNESSYEQIASELDISTNHVGVLLLRAKQQLRVELTQDQSGEMQP